MNWDAIGAVGEILGALAVFGSLVYLALQIRTQNEETRISSVRSTLLEHRDVAARMSEESMAELVVKGMIGLDAMTDAEKFRYINLHMQLFKLYENAYYQFKRERLDVLVWQGLETQLTDYLATVGINVVWGLRKHQFGQEFIAYVDSLKPTEYAFGNTSAASLEN